MSLGLSLLSHRLLLSADNLSTDKFYYDNNVYNITFEPFLGFLLDFNYFDLRNEKKIMGGVKIRFPYFSVEYYNSNKYSQNNNYEFAYHTGRYKTFLDIPNKITEITVSGLLTDTEQFSFFGISSRGAQKILQDLEKCYTDDSIDGIILNIGSIQTTSYGGIGGLVYETFQ